MDAQDVLLAFYQKLADLHEVGQYILAVSSAILCALLAQIVLMIRLERKPRKASK